MGLVWVFARTSAACAALLAMSALAGSVRAQTPDISGTYWATEHHAKIQLVGGRELPLTADGKAVYEKNMAGLKDGSITDTARRFCVPTGPACWPRPIAVANCPTVRSIVLSCSFSRADAPASNAA